MTYTATSRRDDLISMCYLMIYLVNNGKIPWRISGYSPEAAFEKIKSQKLRMTLDTLCTKNAVCLKNFVSEIFGLDFDSKPDYDKLKSILQKSLSCKLDETTNDGEQSPDCILPMVSHYVKK